MSWPVITIVTPSYNQGRFIGETIESVISQAGDFSIEYIIMDGGSTDESVEVIKKYEKLLKDGKWPVRCKGIEYRWSSGKDGGQSNAINKGFRQAKGKYIAWLNSDDTYEPEALKKAIEYLEAHPGEIMAYGEGYYLYEPKRNKKRFPVISPFKWDTFAFTCHITQPSVFLRREVLEKAGYVDESLHYCMDYDWWIRIGKDHKIGYIPHYLSNSRVYPDTKTETGGLKALIEIIRTMEKHYGYIPDNWHFNYVDMKLNFMKKNGLLKVIVSESYLVVRKLLVEKRFPWKDIKRIAARKPWKPDLV